MPGVRYIGNAEALPQIRRYYFSGELAGDLDIYAAINKKYARGEGSISETADADGNYTNLDWDYDWKNALLTSVKTSWDASSYPELQEVTCEVIQTEDDDSYLEFTGPDGIPFELTVSVPYPTMEMLETTAGAAGTNEIQEFYLDGGQTGGTYTVVWNLGSGAETSAAIDYNETDPDVVKAAMVSGMASITTSNLTVTGSGTEANPFRCVLSDDLAETNVSTLTLNVTDLTGGTTSGSVTAVVDGSGSDAGVSVVVMNDAGSDVSSYYLHVYDYSANPARTVATINAGGSYKTESEWKTALINALESIYGCGTDDIDVLQWDDQRLDEWPSGNLTCNTFTIVFKGVFSGRWMSVYTSGDAYESPIPDCRIILRGDQAVAGDVYMVKNGAATGGTYTLDFYNGTSTESNDAVDYNADGPELAASWAANSLYSALQTAERPILWFNADISGTLTSGYDSGEQIVAFKVASHSLSLNTDSTTGGSGVTVSKIVESTDYGAANERQRVQVTGSGGYYTLSLSGDSVNVYVGVDSLGTIETNLEAEAAWNNVTMSTSAGDTLDAIVNDYFVTFGGTQAGTDIALMTIDTTNVTGGVSYTVTTIQNGAAGPAEVWSLVIHDATGGTFRLGYLGQWTGDITFGETAANIETAMQALSTVGSGNMTVSGAGTEGDPYIFTAAGDLVDGTNLHKIMTDNDGLTGPVSVTVTEETVQEATGPWHWDNADNWEDVDSGTNRVPATGDDVLFETGSDNLCIRYALDQSAVALNSLQIYGDFNDGATIGLPKWNSLGYYEYRDTQLQIEFQGIKKMEIGHNPSGGGPSLINILTTTDDVVVEQYTTSSPLDGEFAALVMECSGTGLTAKIYDGFAGFGVWEGQATSVDITQQGGNVYTGPDCTIDGYKRTDGDLTAVKSTFSGTFEWTEI